MAALGSVYVNLQHGDLNPRNVMVSPAGRPVLIDLPRLEHWPIAYDIARLSLQLRTRLTDEAGHLDFFPDHLDKWIGEPVGDITHPTDVTDSICPPAVHCENTLCSWLRSKAPQTQEMVIRSFELGTMWDLVKITSYGDLSVFKRLWALHECDRLVRKWIGAKADALE